MAQDLFQSKAQTYVDWLNGYLLQHGGQKTHDAFHMLVNTIERLKDVPLDTKLVLFMSQPARQRVFGTLNELEKALGTQFPPLMELRADLYILFAETAEILARRNSSRPPNPIIQDQLGLTTLDEVEDTYQEATRVYTSCCLEFIDQTLSTDYASGSETYRVLYGQWISSYLRALGRFLLMRLGKQLVRLSNERLVLATAEEILPKLIPFPQMRDAIDAHARKFIFYTPIEFFMNNELNHAESGYVCFTNLAIIAIIVDDLGCARECLRLAHEFSQGKRVREIGDLQIILNTLNPHVQA